MPFEAHPVYGPMVRQFFVQRLNQGKNVVGTSMFALVELLVRPLALGRTDLVSQYRGYFAPSPSFSVWEVTRDVIERAAELRAKYRLKAADSIHVASALLESANLFLCNDNGLRRITEINVLILDDYLSLGTP